MSGIIDLFNSIRQEKTILFIGAGFSFKAGMPTCTILQEHIVNNFPPSVIADYAANELNSYSLERLSDLYVDNSENGKKDLISLLYPLFQSIPTDLSDHKLLFSIPHFHRIYTTNYDDLLERTCGDDCVVIRGNDDIELLQSEKVQIVKLHGDFVNTDNFIITRSDYDNWFQCRKEDLIWQQLKLDFAKYNVLFIGYSLSDSNLKTVIDYVNKFTKNRHHIYLIAPSMKQTNVNSLKKRGIEFFAFSASDFLNQLIEILEKNIVRDSERKKVSLSTFHKFIKFRNVEATILSTDKGNSIQTIQAINNGKYSFNFSVGGDLYGKIFKDSYPIYDDFFCTPSNFLLPCKTIYQKDLIDCEFSINDIRVKDKDQISKIILAPPFEQSVCSIIVPSASYSNSFKFVRYTLPNEIHYCMAFDGGTIDVSLNFVDISSCINFKITLNWSNTFSNLGELIRFVKALREIWKHSEFKIQGVLQNTITLRLPKSKNKGFCFDPLIDYLNNLQKIELITGECFEIYNSLSDNNLKLSNIILSFLTEKPIIYSIAKHSSLSFDMTANSNKQVSEIVIGKTYSFCTTQEYTEPLILCGKSFNIKYQHNWYNQCKFTTIRQIGDLVYHFQISLLDDNYTSLYTNNLITS